MFWHFRKNMQRNKQVAMGRKKFNMDPKKVGGNNCYHASEVRVFWQVGCNWDLIFTGHPVPDWEWLAEEYQWRHCSVPLQRRRPQQNSHWRLPRREVRRNLFLFYHLQCFDPTLRAPIDVTKWRVHIFPIALFPLCQAHTHPFLNTNY